jgi:hypothetical protein
MPKVLVRYTDQQVVLLRAILEEGTYGRTMEELTVNLLREFTRQVLGREYRKP